MVRVISARDLGMSDLYGDPEIDGVVFDSSESSIPVTQKRKGKKRTVSYNATPPTPQGKVEKIKGGIKLKIGGTRCQ